MLESVDANLQKYHGIFANIYETNERKKSIGLHYLFGKRICTYIRNELINEILDSIVSSFLKEEENMEII